MSSITFKHMAIATIVKCVLFILLYQSDLWSWAGSNRRPNK